MNGNTITSTPTGSLGKSLTLTEFTGNSFTVTSAMVSEDLLVIPQSTTSATLTFSLSINGISHEITKTISIDWKPGTKYTYNITIDPYEITVETTPWDEPEMGDIIVVQ